MRDPYEVLPVNERSMPWRARRKLRRIRREGRGGMLAYSQIPGGHRAPPWIKRSVFVSEHGKVIFAGHPGLQFPKWVDLKPGSHDLEFAVTGWGNAEFTRFLSLEPGEILVVGCRTAYSRTPGSKNPRPNRWYVGIVGAEPAADGSTTWPFVF